MRIVHRCVPHNDEVSSALLPVKVPRDRPVSHVVSAVGIPSTHEGKPSTLVFTLSGDICSGFQFIGAGNDRGDFDPASCGADWSRSHRQHDESLELRRVSEVRMMHIRPTLIACQEPWTTSNSNLSTSVPSHPRRLFVCHPHGASDLVELDVEAAAINGRGSIEGTASLSNPLLTINMQQATSSTPAARGRDTTSAICVNPTCATDGIVATGTFGGTVRLYDARASTTPAGSVPNVFGTSTTVTSLRFSHNGVMLVCGCGPPYDAVYSPEQEGCVALVDIRKMSQAPPRKRGRGVRDQPSAVVAPAISLVSMSRSGDHVGAGMEKVAAMYNRHAHFVSHIELNPVSLSSFVFVSSTGATAIASLHDIWSTSSRQSEKRLNALTRTSAAGSDALISHSFAGRHRVQPSGRGGVVRGRPVITVCGACPYRGPTIGVSVPDRSGDMWTDYYAGGAYLRSAVSPMDGAAPPFVIPIPNRLAERFWPPTTRCTVEQVVDGLDVQRGEAAGKHHRLPLQSRPYNTVALCSYAEYHFGIQCWQAAV
jgi:hypothetical protein